MVRVCGFECSNFLSSSEILRILLEKRKVKMGRCVELLSELKNLRISNGSKINLILFLTFSMITTFFQTLLTFICSGWKTGYIFAEQVLVIFLAVPRQLNRVPYLIFVANATNGVSVKILKWEEFFPYLTRKEPLWNLVECVLFHKQYVILNTMSNFSPSV